MSPLLIAAIAIGLMIVLAIGYTFVGLVLDPESSAGRNPAT
jgi:hypothetical protein